MNHSPSAFDSKTYTAINEARQEWFTRCLKDIPFTDELTTAADLGCGAGFFSNYLAKSGLNVTGADLQQENIDLCQQRYPDITFQTINLDENFSSPGTFDLVLMFGILYHLQSPLQTILRLSKTIGRLGIVETRVAPGTSMACYL